MATDPEIERIDIVDEMKSSYLDYAMCVIVSRALPDVRDGLKPVHRRILFASQEGGFVAGRALSQVRQDRRRRDGQLSPARRQLDLRGAGAHGAGLVDARAAGRRPGQFRIDGSRRSGIDALHRSAAGEGRQQPARRSRQGYRRFRRQLRRIAPGADRPAGALPQPAGQRRGRHRGRHGDQHSAAQPGRSDRRLPGLYREPADRARRADRRSSRGPISPPRR